MTVAFARGATARVAPARPGAPAILGSLVLHATLAAGLAWAGRRLVFPEPVQVYRVDLVAPPAPPREAVAPPPPRETPKPAPAKEEPAPQPKRRRPPEPRAETPKVEPKETPPPAPPEPRRTLEPPNADETVRLEGAPFPYPEYLNNLVLQVKRRWRPPAGPQHWSAEIAFVIHRDGTVTDVEWVRRSGNFAFDLEARGAIETAARQKAFGPLPADYPADRLRVVFLFDPAKY